MILIVLAIGSMVAALPYKIYHKTNSSIWSFCGNYIQWSLLGLSAASGVCI